MSRTNSFVKSEWEMSKIEKMPERDYLDIVDPCESCGFTSKAHGCKPWETCMRQRRHCLRRGEEHSFPTIRRVHIDDLDEERDFACVFETDGSDTITWTKETTRCRVSCDMCWSLAQCLRMKHTLDPQTIAFLDVDDAPGVTPAKRSCKHGNPFGLAKTSAEGRDSKRARFSSSPNRAVVPRAPTRAPSTPARRRPPSPLRPLARPATSVTVPGHSLSGARRSPPTRRTGTRSNDCGDGGGGGLEGKSRVTPPPEANKGKRPARRQQQQQSKMVLSAAATEKDVGGAGGGPQSLSPDVAAGTGAGPQVNGRQSSQQVGSNARKSSGVVNKGSEIYIERLREQVQVAAKGVNDTATHLSELSKVKQHARAQIRDAERLLKLSEEKERQVQAQLGRFKSEEAAAKGQLKDALKGSAEKLKEEAARLMREACMLP